MRRGLSSKNMTPDAHKNCNRGDNGNRCRLYHNKGDGTFVDVAEEAGVINERYAKAAVCGGSSPFSRRHAPRA